MALSLAAFDLTGRVALVTGGSRGIGRALALGLAEAGADVAAVSRHREQCEGVAEEIRALGRRGLARAADVSVVSEADRVVAEILREWGQLDILVNNAGTTSVGAALEVVEEDWDRVLATNLKAVFFWAQAAGRAMVSQGRGKIINISSVGGVVGESRMVAYAASKAGVISVTKTLAREWGRYNVQVNAIGPGYVRTEMNEEQFSDERFYKAIVSTMPLRRVGEVGDLVGAAIYLASSASDFVTGHTLFVDGGRLTGVRGA